MSALTIQDAASRIKADLASMPPVAEACYRVLDWASVQPAEARSHVSVQRLMKTAKLSDPVLFGALVRYLTGARVPLLDLRYEFVEGNDIEPIPAEDIKDAAKNGMFYHPLTGEVVNDYESKIVVYFAVHSSELSTKEGGE